MIEWLSIQSPLIQALIGTIFVYFMTMIGASSVFLVKKMNREFLYCMLSLGAGIMVASVYWGLLSPAIELSVNYKLPWLPTLVGFLFGGMTLLILVKILPTLNVKAEIENYQEKTISYKRSILLILAIALHNIPEGIAIGVAFAAAAQNISGTSFIAAVALTIGIGLQNLPEGVAVALPLRAEGLSKSKSFYYGQLSGMVEPLAGIIGAALLYLMKPLLPYALSFAAGAMFFVIVEELIPESQKSENSKLPTVSFFIGFALMMTLAIALN